MDFSEEQKITSLFVHIIFFASALITLAGFGFFLYEMQANGENILEFIWVPVFILIIEAAVYYMIFQTILETDISREGFGYKYFPVLRKRKIIDFNSVVSWKMKKIKFFNDLGGYGFRRSIFRNRTGYIMNTGDGVEFVLKNGGKKLFSTDNAEMLQSSLRKYIAEKEIKN